MQSSPHKMQVVHKSNKIVQNPIQLIKERAPEKKKKSAKMPVTSIVQTI